MPYRWYNRQYGVHRRRGEATANRGHVVRHKRVLKEKVKAPKSSAGGPVKTGATSMRDRQHLRMSVTDTI